MQMGNLGYTDVIINPKERREYTVYLSDGTTWWARWLGDRWQRLIGTPARIVGWR